LVGRNFRKNRERIRKLIKKKKLRSFTIICLNLKEFRQIIIRGKMMDLQHHHNNYTTPPFIGVGPSVWSPPHVRGCCAIVVPVKCRNQTPYKRPLMGPT